MHDIFAWENFEGFQKLFKILIDFTLGEMPIFPDFLIESASIAKLIEKVEVIDCFENFNKFDYIGTLKVGEDLVMNMKELLGLLGQTDSRFVQLKNLKSIHLAAVRIDY